MTDTRFIVIPATWTRKASAQIAQWNEQGPSYALMPVPGYELLSKASLRNEIVKKLRNSNVRTAVVVLPKSYATGINVKYWPGMLLSNKSGILITSVLFADKWTECSEMINAWAGFPSLATQTHNATCQYQPPYTDMLEQWNKKGAVSFHPGDYYKEELLGELTKMQGHWLYWGHADSKKLHGYHHLQAGDILKHRPASPLQSTLWFSCSTLDSRKKSNIALDWYLTGATYCLLASRQPVDTIDNQRLSMAWLELLQTPGVTSIADILENIANQDQQSFHPVLSGYHLLGLPWVKFV